MNGAGHPIASSLTPPRHEARTTKSRRERQLPSLAPQGKIRFPDGCGQDVRREALRAAVSLRRRAKRLLRRVSLATTSRPEAKGRAGPGLRPRSATAAPPRDCTAVLAPEGFGPQVAGGTHHALPDGRTALGSGGLVAAAAAKPSGAALLVASKGPARLAPPPRAGSLVLVGQGFEVRPRRRSRRSASRRSFAAKSAVAP